MLFLFIAYHPSHILLYLLFLANNNGDRDAHQALLVSHICGLCGALMAAPPHPEKGYFDIVTMLLEMVKKWGNAKKGVVVKAYATILKLCQSRVSGCCPIHGKVVQSLHCITADFEAEDNVKYNMTIVDLVAAIEAQLKCRNTQYVWIIIHHLERARHSSAVYMCLCVCEH